MDFMDGGVSFSLWLPADRACNTKPNRRFNAFPLHPLSLAPTALHNMGKRQVGVPSIHGALDDFVTKLKRKQLGGGGGSSLALARHTTEVLIHAVAAQQAPTVEGIIQGVRAVSKKLVDARPLGACVVQSRQPATARVRARTKRESLPSLPFFL